MSFDLSRNTSNPWAPWRDFFGVVMQQGRVQLDSDWNEFLAEFVRRIQAGTLDLIGLAGVPSTTPYGFKINAFFMIAGNPPTSVARLSIGAGRIYVDGILAENHGPLGGPQWAPVEGEYANPPQLPIAWDPALGEWSGSPQIPGVTEAVVDYTQQPYLPGATLPSGTGPFLVYLDVWKREVSYLQYPDLIEKAVGIDTTGRYQTVWQVKLLSLSGVSVGGPGVTCSTSDASIPPWNSLIQPSSSQLTTALVQLPSTGNCALTPTASYTGLENQLYRVEIHQGGVASASIPTLPLAAGTATFKWSRENASVATAVTAISSVTNSAGNNASQLTVQSLGRDQVLGFNANDWIEILDDYLELNGQPGELHQIDSITASAMSITLDSPVSAANFPVQSGGQTYPYRHTRIRRWDQSGTVYLNDGATPWFNLETGATAGGATDGSAGIPVPPTGTPVLLENGITVAFATANTFAPGEFWTFTARASDGSVENLTNSPTLGIRHHYCRLGIVNFSANPPVVTDCRQVFQSLANPSIHVTQILMGSTQLLNNSTISIQTLLGGLTATFDAPLALGMINSLSINTNSPVFTVTVDMPAGAPNTVGFNPLVLPAIVRPQAGASNTLTWIPNISAAGVTALEAQFSTTTPLLARLTLKGQLIYAQGNSNIYLNGAGDGRPSADYTLSFWIISQPAVTLSTTNIAFTTPQAVGMSTSQPLTITNNSAAALTLTGMTVSGANAADFTFPSIAAPITIAAGSTYSTTVSFDPQAPGTRSALLTLSGTVTSQSPQTVTLSGTAIQPAISASVGSLIFPSTVTGASSSQQSVILTNTGGSQLTIFGITTAAGFSMTSSGLSSTGAGALQPSQQATLQVQFRPTTPGSVAGSLVITHNAQNSPLTIGLTGTAVAGTPGIALSTASISFGTVSVNNSSTISITVTSNGTALLVISSAVVSGNGFAQGVNTCGSLQPGAQCTFQVVFTPTSAGAFTGSVVFTHNAPGGTLTVPLSGTGKAVKGKETKDAKTDVVDKHVLETVVGPIQVKEEITPAVTTAATATSFITQAERPLVEPEKT